MHLPQTRRDYLSGLFDTVDVSAAAFMPVGVGPQLLDPTALPYAGNFMQPDWSSASSPSAPSSPAPVATVPDTSGGWLTQLIPALTAGMNTYAAVEMANNPNAQIARMFSTPAGVTAAYNPYSIPSGVTLPPGVTPAQYAAMHPASPFPAMLLPILIGGGGLLLIFAMMKRR
jgi:hypothetical protein